LIFTLQAKDLEPLFHDFNFEVVFHTGDVHDVMAIG